MKAKTKDLQEPQQAKSTQKGPRRPGGSVQKSSVMLRHTTCNLLIIIHILLFRDFTLHVIVAV